MPISFYLVLLPINENAGLVLGVIAFAAVLVAIWFSMPVIEVSNGQLTLGNATISLAMVSSAVVIDAKDAFTERGPKLSPAAFVKFQPSVTGLVKVFINDPADPTPYWLFSTRKGKELKAAIEG